MRPFYIATDRLILRPVLPAGAERTFDIRPDRAVARMAAVSHERKRMGAWLGAGGDAG